MSETRAYNFWVKVWPAEDLPGEWVVHCLDFDVVTQGRSLSHALMMAYEAVAMTICDDLDEGRDPSERRAPQEFWDEMYRRVGASKPRPLSEIASDPSFSGTIFANLEIAVHNIAMRNDAEREPVGVAMVA